MRSKQAAMMFMMSTLALSAWGHDYSLGELKIGHPYTRTTPPGAVAAGAYLSIENKGKAADKLLRAASPVAGLVELHTMSMDGNVMRMRAVPSIEVAGGATVKLAPGGLHVMLQDLKRPLKEGERIPMTLVFERAGEVKVELAVQKSDVATGHDSHGAHGAHKK